MRLGVVIGVMAAVHFTISGGPFLLVSRAPYSLGDTTPVPRYVDQYLWIVSEALFSLDGAWQTAWGVSGVVLGWPLALGRFAALPLAHEDEVARILLEWPYGPSASELAVVHVGTSLIWAVALYGFAATGRGLWRWWRAP